MHLPDAYFQGLFNETTLDTSLVRLYSALVKLGYFDPASSIPYRSLSFANVSTSEAQQLALQAAEEGMVLLKNDGLLPFQGINVSVALIGSWANATEQMQGNYYGVAPYLHSPLYAAQEAGFTVHYSPGVGGQGDPTTDNWIQAISAANTSDLIIIADGVDIEVESEGMDRYTIDWSAQQLDLAETLAAMGKPTIVAQFGDQLDDTPFFNNPNISAIIWGGYPGQVSGILVHYLDMLTLETGWRHSAIQPYHWKGSACWKTSRNSISGRLRLTDPFDRQEPSSEHRNWKSGSDVQVVQCKRGRLWLWLALHQFFHDGR